MDGSISSLTTVGKEFGTGGFLDPEKIADQFGVQEGMKISDFGSGAGYFTIILAEKTGPEGRVYAFDVQESALDLVRAKARANGIENIETIRTNLEIPGSSSLTEASQDIVLLANILFQSDNDGNVIKEGKRILKEGGSLFVIDWKKGAGGFGPPDDLRVSEEDVEKMAAQAGLKLEKVFNAGQFHFGMSFRNNKN